MKPRMLIRRFRALFTEPQIDEEIATHISLQAAEYERRGMAPEEAYRAAVRQFGGVTQIRESCREQQRSKLVDGIGQDLNYAWRQLRKSPIFALAAVLTLGLGIGANTAVFRGVDALILRSLPVRNASDLVLLQPLEFGKPANFSYPAFRELTGHQEVLRGWAAAGDAWPQHTTVAGAAIKLENARLVTGEYFRLLGVDAALGRLLTAEDDRRDAPPVAVLSYKIWERQFGRSPDVIGKVLTLDSVPVTVVGVAPRHFDGDRVLFTAEIWLPMSLQPRLAGADWLDPKANFNFLDVLVSLRPGVTMAQAQAALGPLYRRIIAERSDTAREPGRDGLRLVPGRHGITIPQIEDTLLEPIRVLMWMVAAVLAIACCNLANLLLARGAVRTHELGVRLALGAGRARLVRQLLTESALLSALGTVAGFVLAHWGTNLLIACVAGEDLDIGSALNWRALVFLATVSIAATCIFGVTPAIAGTRLDIRSALQCNWRADQQGRPRQLLGKAFVIAQVSICLMLLAGAALLGRSLWNLENQDWGFQPRGLLIADVPTDMARDFSPEAIQRMAALRDPLLEKIRALPGVQSAALSFGGPLGNNSWSSEIAVPGRPSRGSDYARVVQVTPFYFQTMGIPIVSGRALGEQDHAKSEKVVVLSQTAARRIFEGVNPIGQYLSLAGTFHANEAARVVGVAHDVRLASPREDPGVVVFAPMEQQSTPFNGVVLRAATDPAALADPVRKVLQKMVADHHLGNIEPAAEIVDDRLAEEQTMAFLAGVLGGLALAMAAVGLYGVISCTVARRTREMGIRLALGATGSQVKGLVLREVGTLLAGGIVVGAMASLACLRVVRSLLYGITIWDGGWLLLVGLLLAGVAAAAGYLPARRAARLDPLEALRQE